MSEKVTREGRARRLTENIRPALTPLQIQHKYNISNGKFYNDVKAGKLKLTHFGKAARVLPEHEDEWVANG